MRTMTAKPVSTTDYAGYTAGIERRLRDEYDLWYGDAARAMEAHNAALWNMFTDGVPEDRAARRINEMYTARLEAQADRRR